MRAVACAAILTVAAAQAAFNYDGQWMTKTPTGQAPNAGNWAASTTGDGFMWVAGGTGNANATYQYSWALDTWEQIGYLPWYVGNFVAPDMVWAGGSLYLMGGASYGIYSSTMWVKSTTNVNARSSGWNMVPGPSAVPAPRNGHSLTILNGYAFCIGGWNQQTYFAGVWAYDLTQLTSPAVGWQGTTWINVVPDNSSFAGKTSPPAMNGHSVIAYETYLVLFGGFYHNAQTPWVSPTDCANNPNLNCIWYSDTWLWRPTTPVTNTPWRKANIIGPSPPGRYGHAAGLVNGETMVIFGGQGVSQVYNDLWSYDISLNKWKQLNPAGFAPPVLQTPVGGSIGRHFVVYSPDHATQLFVYYPPDASALQPPTAPTCDSTSLKGVNAGIVITILLLIAVLVFVVWTWRMQRGGGSFTSPYSAAAAPVTSKDMYEAM